LSDFIVVFSQRNDPAPIGDLLTERPHLEKRHVVWQRFPWGIVLVQPAASEAYRPHLTSTGEFYFTIGRPIIGGSATSAPAGFTRTIASDWKQNPAALWKRLSGVFVLGRCDRASLTLLTDAMGVRPAYVARDPSGTVIAAGSHVPSLALVAGFGSHFDLTSLAELLVFSAITYPFTSHEGIVELPPGSASSFAFNESGIEQACTVLWQPHEHDDPFAPADLSEELEAAMRVAAREITSNVDSVALTLSGGRDSRAVLAALPVDKRSGAITYLSRWNREAEVARRVADSLGIAHYTAMRGADFYERLMERTVALQGSEQRGQAHGLCITDSGLHEKFDLIIGGQFADTYLKDHFMPPWLRASATGSGRFGSLRRMLARARRSWSGQGTATLTWLQHYKLLGALQRRLAEAVRARHDHRLREVERVRPVSAAEWIAIWPSSRRFAAASHVQGNSRLFTADTLYTHRRIVDIAVRVPLKARVNGELANRTFQRLYGSVLGALEDANTGLPANAGEAAEQDAMLRRKRDGSAEAFRRLPPSAAPWDDVQSSWADMKVLQQQSEHWASLRARLRQSPALEVLAHVLAQPPGEFLRGYDSSMPFGFNLMVVQLAHYVDRMMQRRM
jgi:hypothetical protein